MTLLYHNRIGSATPSAVDVLPVNGDRPFWSVMIPTYNPGKTTFYAEAAVSHARELLAKVGFAPAWRQIVKALRLSHSPRVIRKRFSFLVLCCRILGSRLSRWIKP